MKKAVSNSRRTISLEGNVFLELPNTPGVLVTDFVQYPKSELQRPAHSVISEVD